MSRLNDLTFLGGISRGNLSILAGTNPAEHGDGQLYVQDTLIVDSTAQSIDHTTGALVVTGGVGVGRNLTVHQNLEVDGTSVFDDDATFGPAAAVAIQGTTSSTSTTTGQLTVAGGVGIGENTYIGGLVRIQDTTDSDAQTNGALVVDGGAGFRGRVVSGAFEVQNTGNAGLTLKANTDTTGSDAAFVEFLTSDVLRGNISVSQGNSNTLEINSSTDRGITLASGGGNVAIGGALGTERLVIRGDALVTSTIQSTSTTTGALKVAGGLGVARQGYFGDNVNVTGQVFSTRDGANFNAVPVTTGASTNISFFRTPEMSATAGGDVWSVGANAGAFFVSTSELGNLVTISQAGRTTFTDATASSSSTVGSVVMTGGLSVSATQAAVSSTNGGALTVGGGVAVGSNSFFGGVVSVVNTTASSSPSTGAVVVSGGVGVSGQIHSSGSVNVRGSGTLVGETHFGLRSTSGPSRFAVGLQNLETEIDNVGSDLAVWRFDDAGTLIERVYRIVRATGHFELRQTMAILGTTQSTGTGSGALTVAGGVGIVGNTNVGGDLTVGGNIDATGGSVTFSSTTDSSSPTTGAVVISGGLGVAKDVNVGGDLTVTGSLTATGGITFDSTEDSTSTTTGALVLRGGLGVAKNTYIGGLTRLVNTTGSTSHDSGALVVSGGAGIGENLHVQNNAFVQGTTVSTSNTTGALVVSGGLGVAGNVNTGALIRTFSTGNTGLVLSCNGDDSGNDTAYIEFTTGSERTLQSNITYVQSSDILEINSAAATNVQICSNASGGNVRIGAGSFAGGYRLEVAGAALVTGNTLISSTTQSSGPSSGALVVSGGVGVGGNLHADNYIEYGPSGLRYSISNSTATGLNGTQWYNQSGTTTTRFNFAHATEGTAYDNSLHVYSLGRDGATNQEGLRIATSGSQHSIQAFATGGGVVRTLLVGPQTEFLSSGVVQMLNTTNSSSVNTGALVVNGGIGVAQSATVGGIVTITNTTSSTGTGSGALVVGGGAGIGGTLSVGGDAVFESHITMGSSTSDYQAFATGGGTAWGRIFGAFNQLSEGVHMTYNAWNNNVAWAIDDAGKSTSRISMRPGEMNFYTGAVNGAPTLEHVRITHADGTQFLTNVQFSTIQLTDTTDSTAPSNGSLVVTGGLGVAKRANIGGRVQIYDTTASTSTSSGALVVDGGVGIASSVHVGTILNTYNGTSVGGNDHFILRSSTGSQRFQLGLVGMEDTDNVGSNLQLWRSADNGAVIDSIFRIVRATGQFLFQQTTQSSTSSTGAVVVSGGVGVGGNINVGGSLGVSGSGSIATTLTVGGNTSISSTTQSASTTTGALVVGGGAGIGGDVNVGGSTTVNGSMNVGGTGLFAGAVTVSDTTQSTAVSNGAIVIAGGAGIAKNLNVGGALVVGGNTTINGNLVVNGGSITEIRTSTLSVNDNVILINAGPQSSADGGIGIKRFQTANNSGEGDVVNNDAPDGTGTARTGSTSTTVVLASGASGINDFYKDSWIRITSGTGAGQVRRIKAYDGDSKTATLYSTADQTANNYSPVEGMDWATVPDVTSQYAIYDTQYILTYYDELDKEYVFGSTPQNPASEAFVSVRQTINIRARDVRSTGTLFTNSINEHTANAGVTIEGVNVRDGAMMGVVSINGNAVDVTNTVGLIDNTSGFVIIPGTAAHGSYLILVRAVNNSGCHAAFAISARNGTAGYTQRMSGVKGSNNENLDITWPSGEAPRLRHLLPISGASGANIQYVVKVVSV